MKRLILCASLLGGCAHQPDADRVLAVGDIAISEAVELYQAAYSAARAACNDERACLDRAGFTVEVTDRFAAAVAIAGVSYDKAVEATREIQAILKAVAR